MLEKRTINKQFARASQIDRFHMSYSFVYDGYFLYERYTGIFSPLIRLAAKIAGKLPYRRFNSVPFKSEHEAWQGLERCAMLIGDWHATGYARAMRQELCRLEGKHYSSVYISSGEVSSRQFLKVSNIPRWVDEEYLVDQNFNIEDLKLRNMLEEQMKQKRLRTMTLAEHATQAKAGDLMVDGIVYSFENMRPSEYPLIEWPAPWRSGQFW